MKDNNTLARQITKLWFLYLRQHIKPPQVVQQKSFLNHLERNGKTAFAYENRELLDKAMELIPLQRLYEEADDELGGSLEDKVIKRLLHWFKNDFFTWVNNAPCDYCSNTQTRSVGMASPTEDDLKYGAHTVELYQCTLCQLTTRFPRYNDPAKLLETRKGRCGEWANCFTLCCRAIGADARIVFDTTDHVWTEVYSEQEQRWIHCDSCEEAWDKPLIYSEGWNKKLSYCTAFSAEEAVDVTKRYTRNWPDVLKRRSKVKEIHLALFLEDLTEKRQAHTNQLRKNQLNERRVRELIELEEDSKRTIVKDEEMVGRQSGSLAWRTSRGEAGDKAITENVMVEIDTKQHNIATVFVNDEVHYNVIGNAACHFEAQSFIPKTPVIRLTRAVPDQRGGVYYKQPIDLKSNLKGIEVEFAFRVTNGEGGPAINGADGFAFVIQSQSEKALGGGGCELGYGGIVNCLAVEYDTYKSYDTCEDPSSNHISIHGRKPPFANSSHQKYSLGHTSRIPLLQNGDWMKSKIRLLTNGVIEIGLAEKQDTEYIQVLNLTNENFLDYLSTDKAWIGFTASTGGLAENHDIQWISVRVNR